MLYEKLTAIANINKWEKIPSYQTVTRYISYLMEDEGMRNAWFLASRGTREYKNKVMVKGSRDTKGLQVMQIVMGDEHTFDCWVSYKQPNGKVIAIKPHLAAWVDMRSRVIMGDVMCKDANSDILKQSLLKMIYSEPGGVPEYLYIDNGKDYTAKTMTGRDRNDRSGMNFDNETMQLQTHLIVSYFLQGSDQERYNGKFQENQMVGLMDLDGQMCGMQVKKIAGYKIILRD